MTPGLPSGPHLDGTHTLDPQRVSELMQPSFAKPPNLLDMKPLSSMLQSKAPGGHPQLLSRLSRETVQLIPWP